MGSVLLLILMLYCYQVKLEFYVTRSFMYFYMYFHFLLFSKVIFISLYISICFFIYYFHDVVSLFSMNLASDYVALFGVIFIIVVENLMWFYNVP